MGRLASLVVGVAVILVSGALLLQRSTNSGRDHRLREILDTAETVRGGALLVGDSITREQQIERLCGLPVFNAGISGTGVSDWIDLAPLLVRKVQPQLVVYALGVNDALNQRTFDVAQWADAYRHVRAAKAPRVIVLGPLDVENDGAERVTNRIAAMNAALSGEAGYVRPFDVRGLTRDGLHLNERGKIRWVERVQAACNSFRA